MPTVLVIGASSDMAMAIAQVFAKNKYHVQLAGRNIGRLASLQSDIQIRNKVTCTLHELDALQYDTHHSFFEQLTPLPEVTISVIGVMEEETAAYKNWSLTERMIDTNFTGPVSLLNIVSDYYTTQKKGTIVGISSVAGERGRQSKLIYGSTKAAFTTYLDGLRNKLYRSGVHVVTVKPGFVYTKMTQHLSLPALLTAHPIAVANEVYKAVKNRKNTVYVKWIWRWIMLLIRNIPEFQFKKMKL